LRRTTYPPLTLPVWHFLVRDIRKIEKQDERCSMHPMVARLECRKSLPTSWIYQDNPFLKDKNEGRNNLFQIFRTLYSLVRFTKFP
jgi:hypothetical protein